MENRLSRRKFLNTAAAAAALAAIPFNYGFTRISAAAKDAKPNSNSGVFRWVPLLIAGAVCRQLPKILLVIVCWQVSAIWN